MRFSLFLFHLLEPHNLPFQASGFSKMASPHVPARTPRCTPTFPHAKNSTFRAPGGTRLTGFQLFPVSVYSQEPEKASFSRVGTSEYIAASAPVRVGWPFWKNLMPETVGCEVPGDGIRKAKSA